MDDIFNLSLDAFDHASIKLLLNSSYWIISWRPEFTEQVLENLRRFWKISCAKRLDLYSIPQM
jgi:hypothetical protein